MSENPLFASNIKPPSALPAFVTAQVSSANVIDPSASFQAKEQDGQQPETPKFTPEIPASKNTANQEEKIDDGDTSAIAAEAEISEAADESNASRSMAAALESITQGGSSLLGWVNSSIPSKILSKVAETAKSSVDTIFTTLDPQMKEYLYSGGETSIIVASDKEDKIRPVREAFQEIFGRATVSGRPAQAKNIAAQPVGFETALFACQQRIADVLLTLTDKDEIPVVGLENFIVEILPNQWFDVGLLFLSDTVRNISVKTLTQMTPIPEFIVKNLKEDTPEDYQFKDSGYAVTVGQFMGTNLNVHHSEWHRIYTGVSRSEMILNAAKCLASIYKQQLYDYVSRRKE